MKLTLNDIRELFKKVILEESSIKQASKWASRILELDESGQLELNPDDDISKVYDAIIFLSSTDEGKDIVDEFNKLFGETYFITENSRVCKIGKLRLTMSELEEVFAKLIREEISFEEASDWAAVRMEKDKYNELELLPSKDASDILDGLIYLHGVDIQVAPGQLLYVVEDVEEEYRKLFKGRFYGKENTVRI